MLRFKQFIKENYITEANIKHFAHLGLDPENPEHKDLVDAYNAGVNRDPNVPKNPNQIKTFDQLKTSVAPHYAAIQTQRQNQKNDEEAIKNKEAELVHHDPETGVKVFKVRSGRGCAAVGGDTKWCTSDRVSGNSAFSAYDPDGSNSYVIHTPENGNLSRIGIIGVKPGQKPKIGLGGNFQDKGNNSVSDEDWNTLRKKYNLDSVEHLHRVRGIKNPNPAAVEAKRKAEEDRIKEARRKEAEDLVKPEMSDKELSNINSDNSEVHKAIASHKNAKEALWRPSFSRDPETQQAVINHENANDMTLDNIARNSRNPETHKAIMNHKNVGDYSLYSIAKKTRDPEMHKTILNHPKVGWMALDRLSQRSSDPELHKGIANHEKVEEQTLNRLKKMYGLGRKESRENLLQKIGERIGTKS